MKINILCDNEDSWFWNSNSNFLKDIKNLGHKVKICKNENELEKADISAFISCTKIVSSEGLVKSISNIVCHPSDLPKGRGFSPIAWDILNNKNELTFSLFEATENVDEGFIYDKISIPLNGTELNDELRNIQSEVTFSMILNYIKNFPNNSSSPQQGKSTWNRKRTTKDSELNINKSIADQINLLRIVDNKLYPAHFYYKGEKFILKINKENN